MYSPENPRDAHWGTGWVCTLDPVPRRTHGGGSVSDLQEAYQSKLRQNVPTVPPRDFESKLSQPSLRPAVRQSMPTHRTHPSLRLLPVLYPFQLGLTSLCFSRPLSIIRSRYHYTLLGKRPGEPWAL